MSHIPASAMPHAQSSDPADDGPEPSAAAPLASDAPATATGNREGSEADRTARAVGEPDAAAQTPVDGTVTARYEPLSNNPLKRRPVLRSPAGIAALAIGGVAIAGGVAATLFPVLRGDDKPKSKAKKRRRKKG